jgi:acyl-CoA carboxylase subunit beta
MPPASAAGDTAGPRPEDLVPLHVEAPAEDPLGFPGYPDQLLRARDRTGADESVHVGTVELGGLEVVAAIGDFGFLGGSMGGGHGERVAAAMAAARERGLPFLASTSSGGARMQEGMFSLTQMSRASEGMRRLREEGVPTLTLLRHPTTGGVLASYASLADVVLGQAGATVGFAGPRVVETVTGEAVGDDSHTAETALRAGLLDEVVDNDGATPRLTAWVGLLHRDRRGGPLPAERRPDEPGVDYEAWEAVRRARSPERPTARQLLAGLFDEHLELHGDRAGEDDPVAVAAVARLGGRTVVAVGFDRRARAAGAGRLVGQPSAAGYRKLCRAAGLARRHGLPLVSLIDTPGADPSPASERGGVAGAIAETFVGVLDVGAPTVGVVVGEGGSGGALALGCADRLVMQDDAVFAVIAPEGAASILHRDAGRAEEVAPRLRPAAADLHRLGIADRVVPGPTSVGAERAAAALRAELAVTLAELDADPRRLEARRARYGPTGR